MQCRWIGTFVLSAASLILFCSVRATGDGEHSTQDQGAVQRDHAAQRRWKVGQIVIIGNEEVPDNILLGQCPFWSASPVSVANLRQAEENLARLGLFVIDRKRRIMPTVKILVREGDLEFYDVEITVKEKPNVKQLLALGMSIWFVTDWQRWGLCAAILRAEGLPREIEDLLMKGKIRDIPGLIRSRFCTEEKGGIGFAPPAAVIE